MGRGPMATDPIGPVAFRVVKPCGRCVVTTTDQITGELGSQPLKMLAAAAGSERTWFSGRTSFPTPPA